MPTCRDSVSGSSYRLANCTWRLNWADPLGGMLMLTQDYPGFVIFILTVCRNARELETVKQKINVQSRLTMLRPEEHCKIKILMPPDSRWAGNWRPTRWPSVVAQLKSGRKQVRISPSNAPWWHSVRIWVSQVPYSLRGVPAMHKCFLGASLCTAKCYWRQVNGTVAKFRLLAMSALEE